jgi:hypothetical protein
VTAFGLHLAGLALGGFGPGNVLEIVSEPQASGTLLDVELITLSAFCLIGVGVLVVRRRGAGRPLRRSAALLVDSFAFGLLMIAALSSPARSRARHSRRSAERRSSSSGSPPPRS